MFLSNVTAKEVFDIIMQMPKKTYSDLHNFFEINWLSWSIQASETFAKLINRWFDQGDFPKLWKLPMLYLCIKMVT